MTQKRPKPKIDRTMPMVHPNAAAIDVGATMHTAAVRADWTPEPVRSFGTFTTDLHRLVNWFEECGVETVVMESTSVQRMAAYVVAPAALASSFQSSIAEEAAKRGVGAEDAYALLPPTLTYTDAEIRIAAWDASVEAAANALSR